jgi:hypothetical protein
MREYMRLCQTLTEDRDVREATRRKRREHSARLSMQKEEWQTRHVMAEEVDLKHIRSRSLDLRFT